MNLQAASQAVKEAYEKKAPLYIRGGRSKDFYGRDLSSLPDLDVTGLSGVIHYEPAELVIQVGAGTPLQEVIQLLDNENQILAFEPPQFAGSTIGGVIATGISGSRRPYAGAVRDYALGVNIINGLGESLSFGGQVMKNVAGYDVSRLMVGAMGCLGVITEVSLKVLPKPESEVTRAISCSRQSVLQKMQALAFESPLASASAYYNERLYVRFSGAEQSVKKAADKFGGETGDPDIWSGIDTLTIFDESKDLWRVSTAPGNTIFLEEAALIDWGGGQRWLLNPDVDPRTVITLSEETGHATLVRQGVNSSINGPINGSINGKERFQALGQSVLKIHQGLKQKFDPAGILNPQKMYSNF